MKTLKSFLIIALLLMSGLAYSQSGWYHVNDTTANLYTFAVQFKSKYTGYACGSYYGLAPGMFMRTTNGGNTWQKTEFLTSSADDLCFLDVNTGYVSCWIYGTSNSFLAKTTDAGLTWRPLDTLLSAFFKIKFCNYNTGFVVGKYSTVHKTTDGGETWVRQSGVNWSEPGYIAYTDPDTWFVCDGNPRINKTTNGGANWNVLDFSGTGMNIMSINFINKTTGFCGSHGNWPLGKVYKTTNTGENWTLISTIDTCYYIHDIKFVNATTGFIGTSYGIFKTTDGGYNWRSSLMDKRKSILSLSFILSYTGYASSDNGYIFKTTDGGSVFVSNISNEIPDRFELGQNYPNPFNQSTVFDVQCSMKSDISVKVYDAAGREVQTLVNEMLEPGTYQVRFDGSGLSSGLYYYRMTAGGKYTSVKKMIMIK